MLSDEEKQAIEELKNKKADYFMISNLMSKTLLNLIEKQSKEIEHQIEKRANQRNELAILNSKQIEFNKLVNTVNSYKGQFKKQQKEIEELKEDSCCMTNCVRRDKEKLFLEDKIKAKIEEIDKQEKEVLKGTKGQDRYVIKQEYMHKRSVLQSLLEKE